MHKMNQSLTAQDLFSEMKRMPAPERVKFFTLLSSNAFHEDGISHDQVFGHLEREPFSAGESAEYLEVSIATLRRSDVPTFRRYVQSGKLSPIQMVGRNQLFSAKDLRALKRAKQ